MEIDVEQVENQSVAFIRRTVPMDGMREFYDHAMSEVVRAVTAAGGELTGPPFGWYHGMPGDTADVAAGFPVASIAPGVVEGSEEVVVDERIGGKAVVCTHVGPYDTLGETYAAAAAWMEEQQLLGRDDMWEEYVSDPSATDDPSTLETRIILPVRIGS